MLLRSKFGSVAIHTYNRQLLTCVAIMYDESVLYYQFLFPLVLGNPSSFSFLHDLPPGYPHTQYINHVPDLS